MIKEIFLYEEALLLFICVVRVRVLGFLRSYFYFHQEGESPAMQA